MADKIRQGLELMAQAEKAVNKTSWLGKKKPDWETARPLYDEAGGIVEHREFWVLNHHMQPSSLETQRLTIILLKLTLKVLQRIRKKDPGKQLEQAGQILAQFLQKPEEASKLYREASNYFLAHGSPDRAAEMLEKAAKQLEASNVDEAIELYREAISIYESEDKLRTGAETFGRAVAMTLKANRLIEAVEFSHRLVEAFHKTQNRPSYNKQALSTIIIVLLMGDDVDASKRISQYASNSGFFESEEGKVANALLEAFQTYDEEILANAIKRPVVKFLDTEVVKASLRLRVPGSGKKASSGESSSANYGGHPSFEDEDDGDMC
ncbi:hypothetical protein HDU67_008194 [Dinochytrium kinnereticum]|nr:hypothetical protein HDU67_008194 [Dinochytrium kinnereticum]